MCVTLDFAVNSCAMRHRFFGSDVGSEAYQDSAGLQKQVSVDRTLCPCIRCSSCTPKQGLGGGILLSPVLIEAGHEGQHFANKRGLNLQDGLSTAKQFAW